MKNVLQDLFLEISKQAIFFFFQKEDTKKFHSGESGQNLDL